jgi:hypothetical protein
MADVQAESLMTTMSFKALLRIRAPFCAQSIMVFHRSLSALRPLSARIAELSRSAAVVRPTTSDSK